MYDEALMYITEQGGYTQLQATDTDVRCTNAVGQG